MDKTFSEMMEQSKGVVTQTVQNAIKDNEKRPKLSETQQQQIPSRQWLYAKIWSSKPTKMREQFINAFIETAKTTYTRQKSIQWLTSTVGQSVIAKQP